MDEARVILDFRGRPIAVGATVVVSSSDRRLHERVVRRVEADTRWPLVRFEGGGWTTPDRLAVLEDA